MSFWNSSSRFWSYYYHDGNRENGFNGSPHDGGHGINTNTNSIPLLDNVPGASALQPTGGGDLDGNPQFNETGSNYYRHCWQKAEAKNRQLDADLQDLVQRIIPAYYDQIERNTELRAQLSESNEERAERERLRSLETEKLLAQLSDSNNQNQRIREELEQSRAEVERLKSGDNVKIEKLRTQLSESDNQNHRIREQLKQSRAEVQRQRTVDKGNAEIEKLRAQLSESDNQNQRIREELKQSRAELKRLRSGDKSDVEIEKLRARLSESDNQNQRILGELKQSRAELKGLRSVGKNNAEIERLRAQLSDNNNQSQRDREELKQSRAELEELRSLDVSKLKKSVRELESQVKERDRQLLVEETKMRSWMDVRLRDGDASNPVQLREDLDDLKHSIRKLAMVKGINVKINIDAARDAVKYLPPEFTAIKDEKHVLSSVLQQRIFLYVENAVQKFPDDLDTDANLERKIANTTSALQAALTRFIELRTPKDPAAGVLPTRIRQQVFSYVGEHCFEAKGHPLVETVAENLLAWMDQFRTIRNERRVTARGTAERVVKNYVSLFLFRLNAQPADLTIKWIDPGTPFDERRMDVEGTVNENMLVAVCAFPLIEDGASGTVYHKAEVLTFTPNKMTSRRSTAYVVP